MPVVSCDALEPADVEQPASVIAASAATTAVFVFIDVFLFWCAVGRRGHVTAQSRGK
jgi:hypothetical protein